MWSSLEGIQCLCFCTLLLKSSTLNWSWPTKNGLQRAVKEHKLEELINQAREENPLREMESHLDRTHSPWCRAYSSIPGLLTTASTLSIFLQWEHLYYLRNGNYHIFYHLNEIYIRKEKLFVMKASAIYPWVVTSHANASVLATPYNLCKAS